VRIVAPAAPGYRIHAGPSFVVPPGRIHAHRRNARKGE
jgi:quercetin dioxygenase-like cupin family protein